MVEKCQICDEKANYNYNTNHNPAYCYNHKKPGMKKFGSYTFEDIEIIMYYNIMKLFGKK
jgi:hypothetical protein